MNCSRCAQPIEPGATFCGNCGQPVQSVQSPIPPVQQIQQLSQPAAANPYLPMAAQLAPIAPAPAVPGYAMANPAQQKDETKSMVGLILAVLGIPGALIPAIGLAFGIAGLVIGTTTRTAAKKTISTVTIVLAVIAILTSVGSYIYGFDKLKSKASNGGSTTSQNSTSGSGSKSAGSIRAIDTVCFKADFPMLKTLDNVTGSCTLKTYNASSTAVATDIYTIDVLTQKDMTEAQFAVAAKDNLSQALKSNLPGLVVSFEKATTFANSPAYVINGKYHGNIGIELMFAYHQTAHGENVFVIVHGANNGSADTTSLAKNWMWK